MLYQGSFPACYDLAKRLALNSVVVTVCETCELRVVGAESSSGSGSSGSSSTTRRFYVPERCVFGAFCVEGRAKHGLASELISLCRYLLEEKETKWAQETEIALQEPLMRVRFCVFIEIYADFIGPMLSCNVMSFLASK